MDKLCGKKCHLVVDAESWELGFPSFRLESSQGQGVLSLAPFPTVCETFPEEMDGCLLVPLCVYAPIQKGEESKKLL